VRLLLAGEQTVHTIRLAKSLIERGHFVDCWEGSRIKDVLWNDYGLQCHRVRVPSLILKPRRIGVIRVINSHLRDYFLQQTANKVNVDVIHLNYLWYEQVCFAKLGGPRRPYIATIWGSDLNQKTFPKTQEELTRLAIIVRNANYVTADCGALLEEARVLAGTDNYRDNYSRVFWGVDDRFLDRQGIQQSQAIWRRSLRIEAGRPVVLCPRQILPHYNPGLVLEAFGSSASRHNALLLFKEYGLNPLEAGHIADLRGQAASLGIGERVIFVPPCRYEDLPGLYALATVGVSVPEEDGTPASLLELMALGVPLIVRGLAAYQDLIEQGEYLSVLPTFSVPALAEAMERALSESERGAAMTAGARQWIEQQVTWEKSVDAFIRLYERAYREGSRICH
jgi:glycosyltransferase involved in cell wall biosynthesis